MNKTIRWQQRFDNFEKAFLQLQKALQQETFSDLEKEGTIQRFEYTFELSWKTLKDYLESKNIEKKFPADVIKAAFSYDLIEDGDIWMDMLEKRNLLSHTYDEQNADKAFQIISEKYYNAIKSLYQFLLTQKA